MKKIWLKIIKAIFTHLDKKDILKDTQIDNQLCQKVIAWCETKLKELSKK